MRETGDADMGGERLFRLGRQEGRDFVCRRKKSLSRDLGQGR